MKIKMIHKFLQQKLTAQIAFYAVVLFLVYIIAVAPTVQLKKDIKTFKESTTNAQKMEADRKLFTEKYNQLKVLFNPGDSVNLSHERIHEFVGETSKKYRVNFAGFEGPVLNYKNTLVIENHIVTLEGNFNGLLQSLFEIEKNNIGNIVSCSFFKNKDLKTRRFKLYLKIYLQTIRKNENI